MENIKITIYGTSNVGKSTIARLIEKTLRGHGINITMKEDGDYTSLDEKRAIIDASMEERIKAISDKVEIEEHRQKSYGGGMSA